MQHRKKYNNGQLTFGNTLWREQPPPVFHGNGGDIAANRIPANAIAANGLTANDVPANVITANAMAANHLLRRAPEPRIPPSPPHIMPASASLRVDASRAGTGLGSMRASLYRTIAGSGRSSRGRAAPQSRAPKDGTTSTKYASRAGLSVPRISRSKVQRFTACLVLCTCWG